MRKHLVTLLLAGHFGFFSLAIVAYGYIAWHRNIPQEQPIAFSHQIHASKIGLRCADCHTTADKSISAGVPPVEKCMQCHRSVAVGSPEVQKIHEYWNAKTPIPWVRVHTLPEHVYFSHKRHVKADVDCLECHGEVPAMSVVRRTRSLEMGWCVKCHTDRKASLDCWTCHK